MRRMPSHRARAILALTAMAGMLSACALVARDPLAVARTVERIQIRRAGGELLDGRGVILQSRLYDCGPAALANLLRVLGLDGVPAPDSLAALAGTTARGTSLGGLARAAAAAGLAAEPERLPAATLLAPPAPLLAWVDRSHFVVIEAADTGSVTLIDPAVGRYSQPTARFRRRWTGEALVPRPSSAASSPTPGSRRSP